MGTVSLGELIKRSQCYGKLYDPADRNCMRCEAWFTCERKTHSQRSEVMGPVTEQEHVS